MFHSRFLCALTVCLSLAVVACGDDDGGVGGNGTGDSLADAFAEQIIENGELRLEDDRVDCFAGQVIGKVGEDRLGALGFTIDDIPSLYETDWTDAEIDLLVTSLDACVGGDPDSVKVILIGPTLARAQPDLADCYAAEVAAAAGEDFYLDQFRRAFTPQSVADEEALRQVVEPALATCQPGAPPPLPGRGENDRLGPVQDEQWRIALDDEGVGVHTVYMIKTFSPLEEADVEDRGGRLVWQDTEIELCAVGIRGVGDGLVQVGDIFPTNEDGCGTNTGMQQAFDDFGLPQAACVYVRSNGIDDEYCAPLTVG